MVIEDDPVIQEKLSMLLKSNGYEVILPKDFFNIASEVKTMAVSG
jgi:DNA-binding response OmpR family regulator